MTHELEKLQRKGTKPTCPHCHATVLSTSQPERDRRLMVATIIDPTAKFGSLEGCLWSSTEIQRRDLAYSRADEILAALAASTSQPNLMGTTPEMRDALTEAVRLFESYGLIAGRTEADPLAAGRWINNARAALAATPAVGEEPVAWRYKCKDGSEVLMLKRLTDEQKRRGYYTGEDGEDEVDDDEAIVGPFYWAEETPLYAAPPAFKAAVGGEALETLIREYARDLRRNSSGGDDYPWEYAKATADYLEVLIGRAPPASPLRGRVDIEMLLALLNPLHGSLDLQVTEQFTDERELDPPKDREYSVNVTWQMERDLTQAVCILENRLRNV